MASAAQWAMPVLTLGHSNHPLAKVLELLARHGVTALADVRSHPASRFNPQFNRNAFRDSLREAGIDYLFLGRELGARSDDPACVEDGRVRYERIARTPRIREGLERVMAAAATQTVALMCAERDPLTCHRTILVARHLVARGAEVAHIHAGGRLESHDAAIARLLNEVGLAPEGDLFRGRAEVIEEAYARRGRELEYQVPP
jgi:uncharacterized protein (DUF488 family)